MRVKFNFSMLIAVSLLLVSLLSGCAATSKAKVEEKKVGEVIGTTGVIRPSKDVYLELYGNNLVHGDREHRDYAITVQAKDRVTLKFDKKIGFIVLEKTAKEANMSERLFELVKQYYDRSNEAMKNW